MSPVTPVTAVTAVLAAPPPDLDGTLGVVLDAVGTVVIVLGVVLTLVASVGLLSLPDVLSRMHAATKPQVLGLLLVVIGGALHLRTSVDVWMLVLVGAFQLVTAPVTAHVVGRLAHRGDGVRHDLLHVDDLVDRDDDVDPGPDRRESDEDDADDADGPEGSDGPEGPGGPDDPDGPDGQDPGEHAGRAPAHRPQRAAGRSRDGHDGP